MKVVSVINYKGGVGKTTLTANLAAELAHRGYKVLAVDLDPQCSLTFSFISPDFWQERLQESRTIKSWFDAAEEGEVLSLTDLVLRPKVARDRLRELKGGHSLQIIPSHLGLINVDLELASELGGGSMKKFHKKYLQIHGMLRNAMHTLEDDGYDLVLFDCPPNFNVVTKNALVASDFLLTPARPDYLSTLGISYLERSINGLVEDYNDFVERSAGAGSRKIDPTLLGVVFTLIQERSGGPISTQRPYMNAVQREGIPTFDAYVKLNNTMFAGAAEEGIPVVLRSYSNQSHRSVVESLERVASEFELALGLREA